MERARSRSRDRQINEWTERFKHEGYAVLRNVLDPVKDLDPILKEYEEVLDCLLHRLVAEGEISDTFKNKTFADRVGKLYSETGGSYVQDFNISLDQNNVKHDTPVHTGPAVFALLRNPSVLDKVEEILGGEIISNPIQYVRVKPPEAMVTGAQNQGLIRSIRPHQDQAAVTPDADETNMVTVWIPMTDVSEEDGCMVIYPGSHKNGLLNHCPGMFIPDSYMPLDSVCRTLPMHRGDILIMHRLTIHASLSNQTEDRCRVSMDLRYSEAGKPLGRETLPHFVARSRADPKLELTEPAAYALMWSEARSRIVAMKPEEIPEKHRWGKQGWQYQAC